MKNMRIPILSAIGLAILGLIFGSIFDLKLSQAIASPTNGFGLFFSVIGPTIGFCGLAFIGGGFFAISFKQQKMWIRIVYIALAVAALAITVNYSGKEYFGVNGFYNKAPQIVGYLTAAICGLAAEVGGYFVFKDCENAKAWIPFLCVYIVLLLVLLGGITILKDIMHRPRYRTVSQGLVEFHAWWQRCSNYKELMAEFGYTKEEFKSFPSGHTGEASILMVVAVFAPLAHEKLKKIQLPLFIGACAFVVLIAISRILAAAHYLSDVSMGALLTLIFTCIANEVVIYIDSKMAKKAPIEEENAQVVEEEQKAQESV